MEIYIFYRFYFDGLPEIWVLALVGQQEESVREAGDRARVPGQLRHGVDPGGDDGDCQHRHEATAVPGAQSY